MAIVPHRQKGETPAPIPSSRDRTRMIKSAPPSVGPFGGATPTDASATRPQRSVVASPIVLFAYNRPEHTARTLAALSRNDLASLSDLTVFCDGAKGETDLESVEQVRAAVDAATDGFRSVRIIERAENMGLARSIIAGVTQMLEENETVIVLEDDMTTSPYFLTFMNSGLARYATESRVISVCGYTPNTTHSLPDSYFLPGAHCWGWATWRRGWALFEKDAAKLLKAIVECDLIYTLDVDGAEPITELLQRSALGDRRVDSWALRWMASAILYNKLTLYPGLSLLVNDGFDGTGTHKTKTNALATTLTDRPLRLQDAPLRAHAEAMTQLRDVLIRWQCESSRRRRLYYAITRFLPSGIERRIYSALVTRRLRRETPASTPLADTNQSSVGPPTPQVELQFEPDLSGKARSSASSNATARHA
jgi:hypothetical protein